MKKNNKMWGGGGAATGPATGPATGTALGPAPSPATGQVLGPATDPAPPSTWSGSPLPSSGCRRAARQKTESHQIHSVAEPVLF